MLLVLSISLIILSISVFPAGNLIVQMYEKQSLDQLKMDIMQLQAEAITTHQETALTLDGINNSYTGAVANNNILVRKLSTSLHFTEKSEQVFRFSPPFGNISKFKTVIIQGNSKKYALIFQIGKGRFRIEEI
ncbi:hypothetical protein UE46_08635 [Listeria weihenstephanensis]|nr:hypothetical protein UE46_08635 [Listeria weihenstephanensis]